MLQEECTRMKAAVNLRDHSSRLALKSEWLIMAHTFFLSSVLDGHRRVKLG
jgi:hypothetical protein